MSLENIERKHFIIALVATVLLLVFFVIYLSTSSSSNVKECKDSIVLKIDTVYIDKKVDNTDEDVPVDKPIPAITKLKVSDIVCAWGKWSGVITQISWSDTDDRLLIYNVQWFEEGESVDDPETEYDETESEWDERWFYDTELQLGKCH